MEHFTILFFSGFLGLVAGGLWWMVDYYFAQGYRAAKRGVECLAVGLSVFLTFYMVLGTFFYD